MAWFRGRKEERISRSIKIYWASHILSMVKGNLLSILSNACCSMNRTLNGKYAFIDLLAHMFMSPKGFPPSIALLAQLDRATDFYSVG